ncbi:hypothetical protein SAMN04489740_1206 [Arthrobacter alpinus]|uniref:Uncharacterized protein n=1 Tax=Arthrobacter alpinus TaxID=656366 RepID=A0A1H5I5C4_9MICC|nr:hypothetical protein SAMN04489740_1206 [Arthrobacter alpinus]
MAGTYSSLLSLLQYDHESFGRFIKLGELRRHYLQCLDRGKSRQSWRWLPFWCPVPTTVSAGKESISGTGSADTGVHASQFNVIAIHYKGLMDKSSAALLRSSMIDGPELLVALPGNADFMVRVLLPSQVPECVLVEPGLA